MTISDAEVEAAAKAISDFGIVSAEGDVATARHLARLALEAASKVREKRK